ncbi:NAD(P)-dependent oxidoreductase [Pseudolysinimonas yzui]|uniref:Beta-hydroxyacid dehydrogenase n=1 Tax=Pseudolysinimonas yzui TaxID=2708254 RepID=A0A8J3M3Q7_9MICO|nr:NAD(P)-dependent oxidoreductase [Pseudolysinimonas yzui]GHF26636.1 beta-hydroxyacid dehydrogenase [Pseudolysinimonas yzui]
MRVAVIGLGAMGLPMAQRLAEEFSVSAHDVNPDAMGRATESGIDTAATAAVAAARAEIAVLIVRDAAQLDMALFGSAGAAETLPRGSVVVITSTVGEGPLLDAQARLQLQGVHCVDAALSGGPIRARSGDLLVMVGGPIEARNRAQPVLDALASTLCIVGEAVGQGQQLKTVNQLLCGIHTAAAAEALALAHSMGLDLDLVLETLSAGAAASFMFADRGPRIAEQLRGQSPGLRSRLDVISKDMGIVGATARRSKVFTPVAAAAEQLYRAGEVAGRGAEDDSVIVKLLADQSGRGVGRVGGK